MTGWLAANYGTILVLLAVILIVALVIRGMIKDRRAGRTSCGKNCSHCAMAGKCHGTARQE